jgi:hypothetical protein
MLFPHPIDHTAAKLYFRFRLEEPRKGAIPIRYFPDAKKCSKVRKKHRLDGDEVQKIKRYNQIAVPGCADRMAYIQNARLRE